MTTIKKKVTKKKVAKKKATNKKRSPVLEETEKPNPVGRPTKYKPDYCEVIIEKMAEGYSKEAVAGYIGISKNTLYEWAKANKDFQDAIAIGESKSRLHWENKLVEYAVHTKNGKQINGQVFNLNMKNRFGWSDKKEIALEEETKKSFAFSLDKKPEEL
jgi:transposase